MIPWIAILRHAPTILAAADALRLRARSSAAKETAGIPERLDALEQQSRESAQLIQEIAQQIQALAVAQGVAARQAHVALVIAVGAAIASICAVALTVIW